MKKPIYLDYNATTPLDPRVLEVMLPYFTEKFGNAASIDHLHGTEAARAVETAREQVATLINASSADEIIFTSGATESDNLAIIGIAERFINKGKHIITSQTEHKAVLDTCQYLEKKGWEITRLPVDEMGLVDPESVRQVIKPETVLVSIMWANNEIGTIAPIKEIGEITREKSVLFHTDASQAVGHIPVDVQDAKVDLLSLSGHKFYGPKGIGALFVRKSKPNARVLPGSHGGGHERGMRSGTLNVPAIVGIGEASKIAGLEMEQHRLKYLEFQQLILKELDGLCQLNGHPTQRIPHNLNLYFPGIESQALIANLKNDVSISTGSACTTTSVAPSHVILALGYSSERAFQTVRIGLGRATTKKELNLATNELQTKAKIIHRIHAPPTY